MEASLLGYRTSGRPFTRFEISGSGGPPILPPEIFDALNESRVGCDHDDDNNNNNDNNNSNTNDFLWAVFWSRLNAIRKNDMDRMQRSIFVGIIVAYPVCILSFFVCDALLEYPSNMVTTLLTVLAVFFVEFVVSAYGPWSITTAVTIAADDFQAACIEANALLFGASGYVMHVEWHTRKGPLESFDQRPGCHLCILRKRNEEVSEDGTFSLRNGCCRVLLSEHRFGKALDLLQYGEKLPPVTGSSSNILLLTNWKFLWQNLDETYHRAQRVHNGSYIQKMTAALLLSFSIVVGILWDCVPSFTVLGVKVLVLAGWLVCDVVDSWSEDSSKSSLDAIALCGLYMERRVLKHRLGETKTWLYMYPTTTDDTTNLLAKP